MRVAVIDDAGAAIPDAWIEARTGDPLPFLAKTDENGQSSMTRIGPPPWMLKVRASGFETVSQTVSKASAEATKVTLRRLGWIDVNAVDTEGRVIAGATVLVAGSGQRPLVPRLPRDRVLPVLEEVRGRLVGQPVSHGARLA
jgi:hypothetical protein